MKIKRDDLKVETVLGPAGLHPVWDHATPCCDWLLRESRAFTSGHVIAR